MALEMRAACEKCTSRLPMDAKDAFICSYECTFCSQCAAAMSRICPNCGGELVPRPTRIPKS
jgi:hypothetical protein